MDWYLPNFFSIDFFAPAANSQLYNTKFKSWLLMPVSYLGFFFKGENSLLLLTPEITHLFNLKKKKNK